MTAPIRRLPSDLPHLAIEERGALAIVRLDRAAKRNAVNDALIQSLERFFEAPPGEAKAVVLAGAGEHFCAGLDLSEHEHRDAFGVMRHSQMWHRVFEKIQFGTLPVVTAMQGGVIGGGLELAAATHVRVADTTAFYALPEGQRGIFVGGGATVRVGRIVGAGRLIEMMLTGRSYDAAEGQRLGLSHYLVEPGAAFEKAVALAERIAGNAMLSNYAILNAIPRIEDMAMKDGLFTELLMAALAQTGEEAGERLRAFLERRSERVRASPLPEGEVDSGEAERVRDYALPDRAYPLTRTPPSASLDLSLRERWARTGEESMSVIEARRAETPSAGQPHGDLFAPPLVDVERLADGGMILRSPVPLNAPPRALSVWLERWASEAPDRVFLAERAGAPAGRGWRTLTFAEAHAQVRAVAQALLDRGLSPERPILILAENGIDHGVVALAGMHVGIPVAPVSTAYARLSKDFAKLRYILELIEPQLVYIDDPSRYGDAATAVDWRGAEIVASRPAPGMTAFADLLATRPTSAVERANRRRRAGHRRQDPVHLGLDRTCPRA